jgi:FkbH-like protein
MQLREALRTIQEYATAELPPCQVLLACGFNPLHLQTFLQAHLQRRLPGRRVQVSVGAYGDLWGTLAGLPEAAVEMCAIAMEWADLDSRLGFRHAGGWGPKEIPIILENAESRLSNLRDLLAGAPKRISIALCMPTLPLPPIFHTPNSRLGEPELRLRQSLNTFALTTTDQRNVGIVNPQSLFQNTTARQCFDFKADLLTGLPYTVAHADRAAGLMASLLVPSQPKKGLITDLDDTLWQGLVGEVGVQTLCWDLAGQAQGYGLYQQLLRALADQGVLIAAASKNDPEVVEEAFQRDDIRLPRDCVFPMEVHWGAKSESVARILKAWNVGADAVVFVDDSPMEVAEVKRAFPEMECVVFPGTDYDQLHDLLYWLRDLFAKETITVEDEIRRESLQTAQRFADEAQTSGAWYENFMQESDGELTLDFAAAAANPRSLELVNKTNQFNLNGIRYTPGEWQQSLAEGAFVASAAYRDRYGPLGTIAVIKGYLRDNTPELDTWVLSCRAFGRRIEYQCLQSLFERFAAEEVRFKFAPTPRNEYLQEFFARFLGEKPSGPFKLSRAAFQEKCLPLYFKVEAQA